MPLENAGGNPASADAKNEKNITRAKVKIYERSFGWPGGG